MNISVLGTGNMGSAVASGLIKAGHRVTVFNRTREKASRLAAHGALIADRAGDAIRASEFTIVVLLDEAATRGVLLAEDTKAILAGRALISAAHMTPEEITALSRDVASAGGALSEVAISTYPAQVEARQSEFILACTPGHEQAWRRIFLDLGPRVYDVGAVGNASKAQMSLWLSYMFMTIAMSYPVAAFEKLGLPVDVVRALLAGNPTLAIAGANEIIPEMCRRAYGSGSFSVDNMILSIDQAVAFAARLNIDTAVMRAIRDVYAKAASMGYGACDVSALYEAVNPSGRAAHERGE